MKVVVTGGTGFIGRTLIDLLLRRGHDVAALGRHDPRVAGVRFFPWSTDSMPPREGLVGAQWVVHLAGEPVSQRWSESVKRRIRESRVQGTRALVEALVQLETRPAAFVSASAIGFYGDRGDEVLTEESPPGSDFLAEVCVEWEREAARARIYGVRSASLRFGIVLGTSGGALKQMLPPFRIGLGGPVGSGRQWVSWVHVADAAALALFTLEREDMSGAINAVAAHPVRNSEFAHTLAGTIGKPAAIPVPEFALKLRFGEMARVVLSSQRVVPGISTRAGFVYEFPELQGALRNLLRPT